MNDVDVVTTNYCLLLYNFSAKKAKAERKEAEQLLYQLEEEAQNHLYHFRKIRKRIKNKGIKRIHNYSNHSCREEERFNFGQNFLMRKVGELKNEENELCGI